MLPRRFQSSYRGRPTCRHGSLSSRRVHDGYLRLGIETEDYPGLSPTRSQESPFSIDYTVISS